MFFGFLYFNYTEILLIFETFVTYFTQEEIKEKEF